MGDGQQEDEQPFSAAPGSETLRELDTLNSYEQPGMAPLSDREAGRELTFTIVYHPDVTRCGEQARCGPLTPRMQHFVSRVEPPFSHDNSTPRPLLDPYVSRKPVTLRQMGPDLEVTAAAGGTVAIGGEERASWRISPEQLRVGVDVTLNKRIILRVCHALPRGNESLGLIGPSAALESVRRAITRVADLHVPVLIRGETGVGKERVAQAIHQASQRRSGPCVAVNMATLSRETAAAELFGHAKGAFTGAHQRRVGLFEQANGGTLFLDEVAELGVDVQAMLLRVLETGKLRPLGDRDERDVDVRLVSATDAPLEALVDRGEFRAPLLHRLAGFEIQVPALRERNVDVPALVAHFLREELQHTGELARLDQHDPRAPLWFDPELMARLTTFDWPGNVRQLRNVVRQLVVANRGSAALRPDASVERQLSSQLATTPASRAAPLTPTSPNTTRSPSSLPPASAKPADISDDELVAALRDHDWGVGPTAKALGIPRSTLYGLIERSSQVRKASDLTTAECQAALNSHEGDLRRAADELCVSQRALQFRLKELDLA